MGIMDIFKKNKDSNQNDNDSVASSIKKSKDVTNYESHINALHDKGIPLSQAILKLSQMDGFSSGEVLKTFSVNNEGFEDGVIHYFSDDTVLLQKGSNLISNRRIKDFAKKEAVLKEADILFKQSIQEDRIELTDEPFVDLESLEEEILEKEEIGLKCDKFIIKENVLEVGEQANQRDEIKELLDDLEVESKESKFVATETKDIKVPKKNNVMQLKKESQDLQKTEESVDISVLKTNSSKEKKRRSSFALKR